MEDEKVKEKFDKALRNLKITNYLMLATTALLAVTIIVEIIR